MSDVFEKCAKIAREGGERLEEIDEEQKLIVKALDAILARLEKVEGHIHFLGLGSNNTGKPEFPCKPAPKFKAGDWGRVVDGDDGVVKITSREWGQCLNGPGWQYNKGEGMLGGWYAEYNLEPYVPLPKEKVVVVMDDGTRVPGEFDKKMEALTFVRPPWAYMSVGIENRRIDHIEPDLEAK